MDKVRAHGESRGDLEGDATDRRSCQDVHLPRLHRGSAGSSQTPAAPVGDSVRGPPLALNDFPSAAISVGFYKVGSRHMEGTKSLYCVIIAAS